MAGKITYRLCFKRPINDSHANSVLKNILDNKTMGGPICLHNSVELNYARIQ